MPIATGVAYFHDCRGGEFAFYPDGPEGPPPRAPGAAQHRADPRHRQRLPRRRPRRRDGAASGRSARACALSLRAGGRRLARPRRAGEPLARYAWDELRFSVSWKAYCYADEAERRARARPRGRPRARRHPRRASWRDLRERGRLAGPRPPDDATSRCS